MSELQQMKLSIMVHKTFASFRDLCDYEGLFEGNNLHKIVFRKQNSNGNALTPDGQTVWIFRILNTEQEK
jgi:hypothetical protein